MTTGGTEFWFSTYGLPSVVAERARELEGEGWHGLSVGESPNQLPLTFLQLYAAATATTDLLLGTGVTHPAPHPAVTTASAMATIQAESGGRVVVGIGRGDSGHACLGMAPAPLDVFEWYVRRLNSYLVGDTVENVPQDGGGVIPPLSALKLDQGIMENKLQWLDPQVPFVPIDIAATGPKTIKLAVQIADRVTFAVGAETSRLKWAIEVARDARRMAGRPEESLRFGAYVPISVHPDEAIAKGRVRGPVASFARMSAMHPTQEIVGVDAADKVIYEGIRGNYEFRGHFREGDNATQDKALDDGFVDRFGIAGSAAECAERIAEIAELGFDRIVLIPPYDPAIEIIYGRAPIADETTLAERRKLIAKLRG
jgi:5,10-methylenetetrahydromethanopterin reductase